MLWTAAVALLVELSCRLMMMNLILAVIVYGPLARAGNCISCSFQLLVEKYTRILETAHGAAEYW